MIAEVKARTGMTWAEVADVVGTTPTYARKLAGGAGKFGAEGAGKALRGNLTDFQRTGAQQAPVQRVQRVRAPGGGTRPATVRTGPAPSGFSVKRSVFRGSTRDGWAVNVSVPRGRSKTGDREDGRHAIMDATRRAAMGRRRVTFRVTYRDPEGKTRTIELGGTGGYDARRALDAMNAEGRDPLEWFATQGLDRYARQWTEGDAFDDETGEYLDDDDAEDWEPGAGSIIAAEVIALP